MTTQNQIETTIPISLANGGTAASLTASHGGIFYSTASAGAILSGTATAGQLLLSGSSTTPSWSTSTYPSTNAVNTLLYASSANTMQALATANNSVLATNGSGVPSLTTTLPAGITLTTPTLGSATATSITFSPTTGGIVGTTTNDNASAGYVGEYISNSSSPSSITSSTNTVITSISLTAGDWDVEGIVNYNPTTATITLVASGISTTSSFTPIVQIFTYSSTGGNTIIAPTSRISIGTTTTVNILGYVTFTGTSVAAMGNIWARRVR